MSPQILFSQLAVQYYQVGEECSYLVYVMDTQSFQLVLTLWTIFLSSCYKGTHCPGHASMVLTLRACFSRANLRVDTVEALGRDAWLEAFWEFPAYGAPSASSHPSVGRNQTSTRMMLFAVTQLKKQIGMRGTQVTKTGASGADISKFTSHGSKF